MSQSNNKYKRLEALLSQSKPADPNPVSRQEDNEAVELKARIAELESKLSAQQAPDEGTSLHPTSALDSQRPKQATAQVKRPAYTSAEKVPEQAQGNKTILTRLRGFFSAPVFDGDAEKTRSVKLLYQIISLIWVLPVLLVTIGILGGRTEVIPPAIVVSISLLILMVLARTGWVGLAGTLFTALIVLLIGYADFQNAGNIEPSTLMFAVAIIMSGLLLGRRAPIVAAVLILISHATIVYFQMQGLIVLRSARAVGYENIVITSIMILIIGSLFQFVITRLQLALDQARENERELQISNRELQDLGTSLELRVADRTHDLELASEVGSTIAEKVGNISLMLNEATEMIRSRFNLYYTQVYLMEPSGQTITLKAGTGTAGQQLLSRGHHLLVSSGSLNGRAVAEKKPVIVSDTEKSGTFLPNPLLPKTRSEMAIPLMVGNKVLGVLDMQSETANALNEDNASAFQVLAGQLSVAIQNATLFAQSEEARKQMEQNASQASTTGWMGFLNGTDRGEKIGYIFDQTDVKPLERNSKAESGNLLSTPIMVTGATVGTIQVAQDEREWTASESQLIESTAQQLAQHIENLRLLAQAEKYRQEAEQTTRRLTREGWEGYLQTRSALAEGYSFSPNEVLTQNENMNNEIVPSLSLPITVRDEAIGEFMINSNHIDHDGVNELFSAVVTQLGDHIENLRLSEQNEKRAYELATVATVSTTASTVLDPDKLLQAVVDLTKERFNVYHTHIYLADESWNTLLLAAGAGEVGRQMVETGHAIQIDAEKSLVAQAARDRKSVIANDVRSEIGFLPNPMLPETRAEMAVPMIVGDQVIGVFDVQAAAVGHFTEEDINIYTTLAAQVSVALQNARLYVEQAATVTQLRELDKLKSSFLANMSHELRTPLNSILGFTDVMLEELDGPLTPNMDNDLKLIQKNGKHLLHLINDVLDMAKIESGKMNLMIEKFNLNEAIEDVMNITSSLANEKSISLFIEPESDKNVFVRADHTRLHQVLINLVNNGIKFTEKGSVSVQVTNKGNDVLIAVKDTGLGIPTDHLEAVFNEFTQVDSTTTRKAGGTGLGLPISRRLIEMHGGKLWAESGGENGGGSIFNILLPIEAIVSEATVSEALEKKK